MKGEGNNNKPPSKKQKKDDQTMLGDNEAMEMLRHLNQKIDSFKNLDNVVTGHTQQIQNIQEDCIERDKRLERLEKTVKDQQDIINKLKKQTVDKKDPDFKQIQDETKELREERLGREIDKRGCNLIMEGIRMAEGECGEALLKKVLDVFTSIMGLHNPRIGRLKRLGEGQAPPIHIQFENREERDRIWAEKARLKNQEEVQGRKIIWLKQDVPKPVRDRITAAIPIVRVALRSGKYKNVGNHYGNIILDGKFYRFDKLDSLPFDLRPAVIARKENDDAYVFFGRASPLSNHFPARIKIEGNTFDHIEQFLAYKRARYAGENEKSREILRLEDPVQCKIYLNGMKQRADHRNWIQTIPEAILPALKAKVRQHQVVRDTLMGTNNKSIGEAAKYDSVWGIGMALDNPDVLNKGKWPKEGNIMGKAWEKARETIKKDKV